MNYIYENIQFNSSIPIKIFIHNLNYTENHWHDALEILLVLDGSISIGIGNSVYQLDEEGLIVINPNEIHTTSGTSSNLVLVLQIPSEWIRTCTSFESIRLSCNSSLSRNQRQMNQIRKLLAQMMWTFNNQSLGYELRVQSYLFELLYRLFAFFGQEGPPETSPDSEKFVERLSCIIGYLHENYRKDITLQALAEKEYLSVSYLSRFFKRQTGISFREYMVTLMNGLNAILPFAAPGIAFPIFSVFILICIRLPLRKSHIPSFQDMEGLNSQTIRII